MTSAINLNRYRDKLHALRARIDQHTPRLSGDVSEDAESANRQTDTTVNLGLESHEAVIRQEIDAALERINAGIFATCQKCNAVIAARRLDAIPYARYCVRCERTIEEEASR